MAMALVRPIYKAEYLQAWGSIESTFISDARFLKENWPHPRWQPNWYTGTRFDYIYPPALRYGTAAISLAKKCSTAKAYHIYVTVLYSIGIAGVYWLVRAGSRSRWIGLWSAVATAVISPCFLLFRAFLIDYGDLHWMPLRLGVLVRYGEGPHMSSLALLAPVLAAAWYGLRRGHSRRLAIAAVGAAAVVAHNFYGATALAMLFPLMTWSIWVGVQDRLIWARAAAITALAYGLSAFWLTPSYLKITLDNMRWVSSPGHVWSAVLALVVLVGYAALTYWFARGRPERSWTAFVLGATAVFLLDVAGNQYFDFRVIGEPGRLMPELDLALLMAAGLLLGWIARAGRKWAVLAAALATVSLAPGVGYVLHAHSVLPPRDTHVDRIEYSLTTWISSNLPGVRTLATGSLRFWYNAWHDLPELGGGSEQGLLNPNAVFGLGHVLADRNLQFCIAWMQATGTGAVAVHDGKSMETYHDFQDPVKFDGRLEKLFDNNAGDRIYRVPRRSDSLARVVDEAEIHTISSSPPEPDIPTLQRYVNAVEKVPASAATFRHLGPDHAVAAAELAHGQLLLIQESYDPAWRATDNGRAVAITRDPLGFMLLDPGPGRHEIRLRFEMPFENRAGIAFGALTIAALAVLLFGSQTLLGARLRCR